MQIVPSSEVESEGESGSESHKQKEAKEEDEQEVLAVKNFDLIESSERSLLLDNQ